jgi:hypothetical protein
LSLCSACVTRTSYMPTLCLEGLLPWLAHARATAQRDKGLHADLFMKQRLALHAFPAFTWFCPFPCLSGLGKKHGNTYQNSNYVFAVPGAWSCSSRSFVSFSHRAREFSVPTRPPDIRFAKCSFTQLLTIDMWEQHVSLLIIHLGMFWQYAGPAKAAEGMMTFCS